MLIRIAAACAPFALAVSLPVGSASAGIGSDKTKIAQIEQRIATEGARAQALVSNYNKVAGRLAAINAQIAHDRARLASDRKAELNASFKLRHFATDAYVAAMTGNSPTIATMTGSSNSTTLPEQQVYLGVANGSLDDAVANLEDDQHRTATVQVRLNLEQDQTAATLRELDSSHRQAQVAISADQSTLSSISSNLLALVDQANQRREQAEEQRAEQTIAAVSAQQATASPTSAASAPVVQPSSGSYANPLRGLRGVRSERIDQGVDFSGFGPIFAVGDGVVLSTQVGGWPGGTFISYRLTDGPEAGLVVYSAESIDPEVHVGQTVHSSTVIGQVYGGSEGIELGWTDSTGQGTTMAADNGQYGGGNSTAFGYNFSQFLQSLGAPGGILENNPPSGSIPASWPHF